MIMNQLYINSKLTLGWSVLKVPVSLWWAHYTLTGFIHSVSAALQEKYPECPMLGKWTRSYPPNTWSLLLISIFGLMEATETQAGSSHVILSGFYHLSSFGFPWKPRDCWVTSTYSNTWFVNVCVYSDIHAVGSSVTKWCKLSSLTHISLNNHSAFWWQSPASKLVSDPGSECTYTHRMYKTKALKKTSIKRTWCHWKLPLWMSPWCFISCLYSEADGNNPALLTGSKRDHTAYAGVEKWEILNPQSPSESAAPIMNVWTSVCCPWVCTESKGAAQTLKFGAWPQPW